MASVKASRIGSVVLALLSTVVGLSAQVNHPDRVLLRVDEISVGPYAGQKSASCLRVYSDGRVVYAEWSTSLVKNLDTATGVVSRPERTSAFSYVLVDFRLEELASFLKSKAVRKLREKFGPPHKAVDYAERVSVEIPDGNGPPKRLSTAEYHVADLEEKTRYPSAFILLMDRIDQIEREATASKAALAHNRAQ
jgi:hypothetical protein